MWVRIEQSWVHWGTRSVRWVCVGALALLGAACGTAPSGTGGAGGTGSSTNSTSTGAACTPMDVSTCPQPAVECAEATCDAAGVCGERPKDAHSVCASAKGAGVCDGASNCIGCVDASDCPTDAGGAAQLCLEHECFSKCDNGMCPAGKYCDTATQACVPQEAIGVPCTEGDGQCASGHCVDGVCCESACDTKCESCAMVDTGQPDGSCRAVVCTGSMAGAVCQATTTGNCGCSAATEATDCADVPGKPHCVLSGPHGYVCAECWSNVQCVGSTKGHTCAAEFDVWVCGCFDDPGCAGIAGKTHCALSGPNKFSCRECASSADCPALGDNNFCGDGTMGTTANVCGCRSNADCLNGTTCNGSNVCI